MTWAEIIQSIDAYGECILDQGVEVSAYIGVTPKQYTVWIRDDDHPDAEFSSDDRPGWFRIAAEGDALDVRCWLIANGHLPTE